MDINVIHGDCFDVMRSLPSGSIDMVLCDPPYGTTSNKWDSVLPLDQLWEQWLRLCKETAVMVITTSQPFTSSVVLSRPNLFRHEWVWIKNRGSNFANTVREPMKEHENILVFSRGKWTYNKQMQVRTGGGADRVKYNVAFQSKSENYREFEGRETNKLPDMRVPSSWQKFNCEVGLHPTQKPVALFEYLIKTYTNEGEVVLDCCAGAGTTGVAAFNLNRRAILIEKEKKYIDVISERLLTNILAV